MKYYKPDGTPYEDQSSPLEWAKDFDDGRLKIILRTEIPMIGMISTVWLGLNHQLRDGPPLIFETMFFPNPKSSLPEEQERYSTRKQAKEGHNRMVKKLMKEK